MEWLTSSVGLQPLKELAKEFVQDGDRTNGLRALDHRVSPVWSWLLVGFGGFGVHESLLVEYLFISALTPFVSAALPLVSWLMASTRSCIVNGVIVALLVLVLVFVFVFVRLRR